MTFHHKRPKAPQGRSTTGEWVATTCKHKCIDAPPPPRPPRRRPGTPAAIRLQTGSAERGTGPRAETGRHGDTTPTGVDHVQAQEGTHRGPQGTAAEEGAQPV